MSIALRVDTSDPTPPYEQLRRQLAALIRAEAVVVGTKLPTVRQLAQDLGLAPGTVMRTYRELESEGLIASRRGQGTVVVAAPAPAPAALATLAGWFVAEANRLGAAREDVLAAVEAALAQP